MTPSEPLDYILDLGHSATCLSVERARTGEELTVLVYPERDHAAARIPATGTLSPNGQWFIVDVITPDGKYGSYPLDYQELKHISSLCNL